MVPQDFSYPNYYVPYNPYGVPSIQQQQQQPYVYVPPQTQVPNTSRHSNKRGK